MVIQLKKVKKHALIQPHMSMRLTDKSAGV